MFNNNLLMAAASASGESLVEIGNSALYTTTSQELERTPGSAGNVDKFTFSTWVYLCNPTSGNTPIFGAINTSANQHRIFTTATGTLQFDLYLSNSFVGRLITTQVLRDIGWYHIVAVYDSGNSLADSRMILYLNGERITDLSTETMPSQNQDGLICGTHLHQIGMHDGLSTSMDGYMAEAVLIDGSVLTPTSFGQYDSTGTFWTPKSSAEIKALTFGTTGFYLDNTTNAQTDASGTGNNFTNTGSVATTTHTPTNINCLLNQLWKNNSAVLSNGNRTKNEGATGWQFVMATLGVSSGKYYWEVKAEALSDGEAMMTGIANDTVNAQLANSTGTGFYGYSSYGVTYSTSSASYGDTYGDDDIIGVQLNMDDGEIHFYKNNTIQNSGTAAFTGLTGVYYPMTAVYNLYHPVHRFAEDEWSYTAPTGYKALTTTNIASAITRTHSNLEEYFDSTLYEGNGTGQRVGKFLPFTNTFTVGKGALFIGANSEDLSRGSMSGTATTFTVSMWVKRAEPAVGGTNANFMFTTASDAGLAFGNNSTADVLAWYSGSYTATTRVFSDQSQWMNVVLKSSSGTGTAYVNGVEMLSSLTVNGADATMAIGSYNNSSNFFDGYMAEVVMIDGTALEPSSFGQVDTSTGRWIPKDVSGLTFGTNGFYLNFANSSDVGNDVSGNNNDFTNNNTVVQVGDTPTVNFGTLNVSGGAATVTNGNRTNTGASGGYGNVRTSLTFGNEKIFAMLLINDGGSGASVNTGFSVAPDSYVPDFNNAPQTGTYANVQTQGTITRVVIGDAKGGTVVTLTHSIAVADGDYLTMAVDPANGVVWFGIYDTSASSHQYLPAVVGGTAGDPANGTLPTVTNLPFNNSQSCIMSGGFGTSSSSTIVFNSADMPMSLPTDYLEFKQDNLATGESYQTAFSWIKNRDATDNHMVFDRLRGIYNNLHFNTDDAQNTNVNTLQRFLNGGVQVGNDVQVNTAAESYVAWNWYFETTGSGSSNTDGTINTTSTLVDTNIGLSISQYTGTGNNATVGHGLGVAPQFIIVKKQNSGSAGDSYYCYHIGLDATSPANKRIILNSTAASAGDSTYWNDTVPTSSVFSLGTTTNVNGSGTVYISYAFAPSQFTAIGSYKGNGNDDGVFVPTVNSLGIPIQPAWWMMKRTDNTSGWNIVDTSRDPFNEATHRLEAQANSADNTANGQFDLVLGGFKFRNTNTDWDGSGASYIYMAFGTPIIDVDGRIITGR